MYDNSPSLYLQNEKVTRQCYRHMYVQYLHSAAHSVLKDFTALCSIHELHTQAKPVNIHLNPPSWNQQFTSIIHHFITHYIFTVFFQHQFNFVVVFLFMTNGCFTAMKREDDLHPPQERLTNTEARKNQDHTGVLIGSALAPPSICAIFNNFRGGEREKCEEVVWVFESTLSWVGILAGLKQDITHEVIYSQRTRGVHGNRIKRNFKNDWLLTKRCLKWF